MLLALGAPPAATADGLTVRGSVRGPEGNPVVGAQVRFSRGDPAHHVAVRSGRDGRFRVELPGARGPFQVSARAGGWRPQSLSDRVLEDGQWLRLVLEPVTDPAELAAQRPANAWYDLVLRRLEGPREREELKRACTACHQQGDPATRAERGAAAWEELLAAKHRRGIVLSQGLRLGLPRVLSEAYAPARAIPLLRSARGLAESEPASPAELAAAVEEWDLGEASSRLSDFAIHPDGHLYALDLGRQRLLRLDPETGLRAAWPIPTHEGRPDRVPMAQAGSDGRGGPVALRLAPDGALWIALSAAGGLARFDPARESFRHVNLSGAYAPHTLRFDGRGRLWYTLAASNRLGMWDPVAEAGRVLRLPSRTLGQALAARWLPLLRRLRGLDGEPGSSSGPAPSGVDVAPDGSIWFSQPGARRIGRVDPDRFRIEVIETPFDGPLRLRFAADGKLWTPGFSSGRIASFDPATREFREYALPSEPPGSDTPYALAVHPETGDVWVCGSNSDSLIRLDPANGRFLRYPLPTPGSFTRDIAFDSQGRVWTVNSMPAALRTPGLPARAVRLDPGDSARAGPRP